MSQLSWWILPTLPPIFITARVPEHPAGNGIHSPGSQRSLFTKTKKQNPHLFDQTEQEERGRRRSPETGADRPPPGGGWGVGHGVYRCQLTSWVPSVAHQQAHQGLQGGSTRWPLLCTECTPCFCRDSSTTSPRGRAPLTNFQLQKY